MILALLLVTVFFALAHILSAAAILCVAAVERPLTRLSAQLRTRLYWIALIAPLTGGTLGIGAALVPSLLELAGYGTGHCLVVSGHHVHLCFLHFAAGTATLPIACLGTLVLSVAVTRAVRSLLIWTRERRAFAFLVRAGRPRPRVGDVVEFDSELPVCVTMGLRAPQVFVSTGAVRSTSR